MSFMPIQDTPVIRILEQAATQLTPTGPFSDWLSLSVLFALPWLYSS